MSQFHSEYFTIDEAFDVPPGFSLFGRSPDPNTPWPQPGETIEMRSPDGKIIQAQVLQIDQDILQIPGANPAARAVLIPRQSVSISSLAGFKVFHSPHQQHSPQSALTQSRKFPIALIWLLVVLIAIIAAAALLYSLR
jgi:hypothetical protein